jgi:hypothetical protein
MSADLDDCDLGLATMLFHFDGKTLKPAGAIKVSGGPAGIATTPPK